MTQTRKIIGDMSGKIVIGHQNLAVGVEVNLQKLLIFNSCYILQSILPEVLLNHCSLLQKIKLRQFPPME